MCSRCGQSYTTKNGVSVRPSVRPSVRSLKSTSPYGVRRVASLRTHRVLMRVYVFFEHFLRLNRRFKRGFARVFHTRFIKFVTFTDRVTYFGVAAA